VAQGVITGIRGLCNGLGPALFGLVFYLFDVNLYDHPVPETAASGSISMMLAASNRTGRMSYQNTIFPSNRVRCDFYVSARPDWQAQYYRPVCSFVCASIRLSVTRYFENNLTLLMLNNFFYFLRGAEYIFIFDYLTVILSTATALTP